MTSTNKPRMNFRRSGRGAPLVLLHGFLGGGGYWMPQIASFRIRFEVIAPDLPGFAGSGHLPAPREMSGYVQALIQFLDANALTRVNLVGHSMGGMIAQETAVQAPERLERLILYGTACSGEMPGRFETYEVTRERLHSEGLESVCRNVAAKWFVEGEKHPHHETCVIAGKGVTVGAAEAALQAMSQWRFESQLERIVMPTLVICGDQDRSCNVDESIRLWRSIAGARLAVVPRCSHNVHLERSMLFDSILHDFLAGC